MVMSIFKSADAVVSHSVGATNQEQAARRCYDYPNNRRCYVSSKQNVRLDSPVDILVSSRSSALVAFWFAASLCYVDMSTNWDATPRN